MGKIIEAVKRTARRNITPASVFVASGAIVYFGDFYDWDSPFVILIGGYEIGFTDRNTTFFALGLFVALATVLGVVLRETNNIDVDELREQVEKLEIDNGEMSERLMTYFSHVVRDFVQGVFDHFEFAETERITIYKVEEGHFWPIARVSENHEFRELRRQSYPRDQGCIGEAWRSGSCHFNRYPEDIDDWCERQATKWGYSTVEAASIRMKSRSLFAFRVSRTSADREALAVLVFESTLQQKISIKNIEKIKEYLEEHQEEMERILVDYHEYGPSSEENGGVRP